MLIRRSFRFISDVISVVRLEEVFATSKEVWSRKFDFKASQWWLKLRLMRSKSYCIESKSYCIESKSYCIELTYEYCCTTSDILYKRDFYWLWDKLICCRQKQSLITMFIRLSDRDGILIGTSEMQRRKRWTLEDFSSFLFLRLIALILVLFIIADNNTLSSKRRRFWRC